MSGDTARVKKIVMNCPYCGKFTSILKTFLIVGGRESDQMCEACYLKAQDERKETIKPCSHFEKFKGTNYCDGMANHEGCLTCPYDYLHYHVVLEKEVGAKKEVS